MDLLTIIQGTIAGYWNEEYNPPIEDVKFAQNEFNPNDPKIQILLETNISRNIYVAPKLRKVEETIKISVFVRPINFSALAISNTKTIFDNVLKEIDRILNGKRTSIDYVATGDILGWKTIEMNVGRGTKKGGFQSEQLIKCTFYPTEEEFTQWEFPFIFLS